MYLISLGYTNPKPKVFNEIWSGIALESVKEGSWFPNNTQPLGSGDHKVRFNGGVYEKNDSIFALPISIKDERVRIWRRKR